MSKYLCIPSPEKLTKKQVRLIAKIWVGSMAHELDGGFSEEQSSVPEKNIEPLILEAQSIGHKLLGNHPSFSDLNEIVKYVKSLAK